MLQLTEVQEEHYQSLGARRDCRRLIFLQRQYLSSWAKAICAYITDDHGTGNLQPKGYLPPRWYCGNLAIRLSKQCVLDVVHPFVVYLIPHNDTSQTKVFTSQIEFPHSRSKSVSSRKRK